MKINKDNSWMLVALSIIIIFLILVGLSGMNNYGMMYMMSGSYGYGIMFLGWIVWILILALVFAVIYWLLKNPYDIEIKKRGKK